MTFRKPRIGITLDKIDPCEEARGVWYSKLPWYALRYRYTEAVAAAGGIPLALPYYPELVDHYVHNLDGLVITGGGFDVDPRLYGDSTLHPTVRLKPDRTEFEMAITKRMLELDKPVLGICGGMQLINVLHGGSLYQHLPAEVLSDINHSQDQDRHLPQHSVTVQADTLLGQLIKTETVAVNSVHHQAVKNLAPGFQVNAVAADGIVEGIESSSYRFCLGIQWHPEFHVTAADRHIFDGFIEACCHSLSC